MAIGINSVAAHVCLCVCIRGLCHVRGVYNFINCHWTFWWTV